MSYDSDVFFGFCVNHNHWDPYRDKKLTIKIRQALIKKLAECSDSDLLDNVEITETIKKEDKDG